VCSNLAITEDRLNREEKEARQLLAQNNKGEYDALEKIMHYQGDKGKAPPWVVIWGYRISQVSPDAWLLYLNGLHSYQGKSFTEILKAERKARRLREPRTLDKRLKLLMSHELAYRRPREGGRGRRGKYYFERLAEIPEDLKAFRKGEFKGLPHAQYIIAPSVSKNPAVRAKELAKKMELAYIESGLAFATELRFLSYIENRRDLMRSAAFEMDLAAMDMSMYSVALVQNYRDVMSEGLKLFYQGMEKRYGMDCSRLYAKSRPVQP